MQPEHLPLDRLQGLADLLQELLPIERFDRALQLVVHQLVERVGRIPFEAQVPQALPDQV